MSKPKRGFRVEISNVLLLTFSNIHMVVANLNAPMCEKMSHVLP